MRLIDADALLEEYKYWITRDKDTRTPYDLITNAPTVQREGWISVKDRLPEDGQEIIGCSAKGSKWLEYFDSSEPIGFMVLWIPAPAAPDTE